jgi:hypothetical protein
MTDKITIQRAFNSHFIELMNDIVSIYPDNVEIISAKNSFESIKRLNPTTVIKAWHKFINIPYGSEIENGNLSFFFEKDYQTDLSHLNNVDEILKIIDKVRGPLQNMTNTNKEHTGTYLKNLGKLSLIYSNL